MADRGNRRRANPSRTNKTNTAWNIAAFFFLITCMNLHLSELDASWEATVLHPRTNTSLHFLFFLPKLMEARGHPFLKLSLKLFFPCAECRRELSELLGLRLAYKLRLLFLWAFMIALCCLCCVYACVHGLLSLLACASVLADFVISSAGSWLTRGASGPTVGGAWPGSWRLRWRS